MWFELAVLGSQRFGLHHSREKHSGICVRFWIWQQCHRKYVAFIWNNSYFVLHVQMINNLSLIFQIVAHFIWIEAIHLTVFYSMVMSNCCFKSKFCCFCAWSSSVGIYCSPFFFWELFHRWKSSFFTSKIQFDRTRYFCLLLSLFAVIEAHNAFIR